jgi:hypothetical protein
MTDLRGLEELWRRALDLNLRYYSGLGKLTAEYLKEVVAVMSSAQPMGAQPAPSAAGPGTRAAEAPQPEPAKSAGTQAVMVLEGEAGSTALGVFLVGNSLPGEVSATITSSRIVDENDREGQATFVFNPSVITLRPGEQMLVRVSAVIDPSLEPGARYRGELSIPELGGTRVPLIVRRRPTGKDAG